MSRSLQVSVVLVGSFVLSLLFASPADARRSSVEVNNRSEWTIVEFYMSPSDDDDWGRDLLGRDVLEPGDTLTLTNISCDDWDLMFIDEDEDTCVLESVDLCGDTAEWDITSRELVTCIDESN